MSDLKLQQHEIILNQLSDLISKSFEHEQQTLAVLKNTPESLPNCVNTLLKLNTEKVSLLKQLQNIFTPNDEQA